MWSKRRPKSAISLNILVNDVCLPMMYLKQLCNVKYNWGFMCICKLMKNNMLIFVCMLVIFLQSYSLSGYGEAPGRTKWGTGLPFDMCSRCNRWVLNVFETKNTLTFYDAPRFHVNAIIWNEWEGPDHSISPIRLLLMAWLHREANHLQPWYWPSTPGILRFQHK